MIKIYCYRNKQNGKVYIGQTCKSLAARACNGNGYRDSPRFYNAIKKYGWDMFESSVLSEVETRDEANALEQYYIKLYNSVDPDCGYNISFGGDAGCIDEESRKTISEKAKQRYKDPTKNPMYGKKHSREALSKMSLAKQGKNNPMYGRKWNDNQRATCGKHGWHYEMTPEQKKHVGERARRIFSKPILCVETGEYFDSITDASKSNGVSISTLSGHLNGRQHICAGKHFAFVDKDRSQTTNCTVEISTTGSGKHPQG